MVRTEKSHKRKEPPNLDNSSINTHRKVNPRRVILTIANLMIVKQTKATLIYRMNNRLVKKLLNIILQAILQVRPNLIHLKAIYQWIHHNKIQMIRYKMSMLYH